MPPGSGVYSEVEVCPSITGSSDECGPARGITDIKAMMNSRWDEITRSKTESPWARTSRRASPAAPHGDSSHTSVERVPSAASEPAMGPHVDGMIDRLQKLEDTIHVGKAAFGCEPLHNVSSSAATAGSSTCPTLDLGLGFRGKVPG